ncbi:hypothetical protein J6590_043256 [Homalodisca vitripennis]|nr:hypothetical protein J6590_043256 [Homalodisca vitripennis]
MNRPDFDFNSTDIIGKSEAQATLSTVTKQTDCGERVLTMSQRKCFRDAAHNATPPPLPPITTHSRSRAQLKSSNCTVAERETGAQCPPTPSPVRISNTDLTRSAGLSPSSPHHTSPCHITTPHSRPRLSLPSAVPSPVTRTADHTNRYPTRIRKPVEKLNL